MTGNPHLAFDREYQQVCDDLVLMSQQVDKALDRALRALDAGNVELAMKVIDHDEQINACRFKIEEACLVLIATRQPAAGDLRAVVAAMHIVVELERMGDHAAGIAKTVILMKEEPLLKTLKKLPKMGELGRKMLADSIQAFLKRDAAWATQIAAQDDTIDQLYRSVFDKLVETMAHKPELAVRATYLLWCAHNLERISDRVTNIAERVVFMTTGALSELNTG